MKHTLRQIFHSSKFVVGFTIFMAILLTVIFYPLLVNDRPLAIIAQGTFFEPGIYVNVYDSLGSKPYTLKLDEAAATRIASKLGDQERLDLKEWLVAYGIPEGEIDIEDTEKLMGQWVSNYDPSVRLPGMTAARRNYFERLDISLEGISDLYQSLSSWEYEVDRWIERSDEYLEGKAADVYEFKRIGETWQLLRIEKGPHSGMATR